MLYATTGLYKESNTFLTTDLHGKSTQTLQRLDTALCFMPQPACTKNQNISKHILLARSLPLRPLTTFPVVLIEPLEGFLLDFLTLSGDSQLTLNPGCWLLNLDLLFSGSYDGRKRLASTNPIFSMDIYIKMIIEMMSC